MAPQWSGTSLSGQIECLVFSRISLPKKTHQESLGMGRDVIVHKQSGLLLMVLWPSVLTTVAAMVLLSQLTPKKWL